MAAAGGHGPKVGPHSFLFPTYLRRGRPQCRTAMRSTPPPQAPPPVSVPGVSSVCFEALCTPKGIGVIAAYDVIGTTKLVEMTCRPNL